MLFGGRGDDESQEDTEEQQEPAPVAGASIYGTECARSVLSSIELLSIRFVSLPLHPSHVRPLLVTVAFLQ
jgi:hypothetical protein